MLWIRSQNKKILIKASELFVQKHYGDWIITDYPEDVPALGTISGGATGGGLNLGIYKTEKRAFEVLDEIAMYLVNSNVIVYDMPAE